MFFSTSFSDAMCLVGHSYIHGWSPYKWSMGNCVISSQFVWMNIVSLSLFLCFFNEITCFCNVRSWFNAFIMLGCVLIHLCACFTWSSVHTSTLHPFHYSFIASSCFYPVSVCDVAIAFLLVLLNYIRHL